MRRLLAVLGLLLAFLAMQASAQSVTTYTFATLPGSPTGGQLAWISDGNGTATQGSPAAGGGTNKDLVAYDSTQTRWEFVTRIGSVGSPATAATYIKAIQTSYDPTVSGASATNVQAAIDALFASGGGGATNLGATVAASQVTVTSSTGTSAVIPAATTSNAGVFSSADKTKLNGIETAATADQLASEVPFVSATAAWTSSVVSVALDYLYDRFSRVDEDNDGLYESAYLWDADNDGSGYTVCTGNATPDIRCKAVGEILYPDFIDDANCATMGCGNGKMERGGKIRLRSVVYVGFSCWKPGGTNTASAHETNDDAHDQTSDAAYTDCPLDPDGKRVSVLSLRDWGGIFEGEGADLRRLDRGSMGASLRRDVGTYVTNDMGPWDLTNNNNVLFGSGDNARMISTGFHSTVSDPLHVNGGSAADGDSKGWWKVALDVNFETWVTDNQMLCLQNTAGGGVGVDYKTSGTVSNLSPGDLLIVPVKPTRFTSPASSYNTFTATVSSVGAACGTGGVYVNIGGSYVDRTSVAKYFPAHAAGILAADNVKVIHARTGYDNTDVTFSRIRFEPQDPWNEFGGRCTNSGTAWRSSATATGTAFSLTTDDTNTSMACDTTPLFGLWGGGHVRIVDSVIYGWHKYALDAGGTGFADVERVHWIYGNGNEAADISNGWRFRNNVIDQSYFVSAAFNIFAPGAIIDGLTVRNSVGSRVVNLDHQSPRANIRKIDVEGSSFNNVLSVTCGAQQNIVRDVWISGRGGNVPPGLSPSLVFIDCDETARPVTQNTFENLIVDGLDVAAGAETAPVVAFNVSAATSNPADSQWGAIFGNTFSGVRSTGYTGGTAGESACLYGIVDADTASPADGGDSVIFTKNYFANGSVEANGRVFCVTSNLGTATIDNADISSATGNGTPAWGDPQGCGNMDGGVMVPWQRCDAAELGNGRITIDFASMAAGACTSATTQTLTGLTTTDSVRMDSVGDLTGTTGYTPSASVILSSYATANTLNFKACNPTGSTLDPASATFWWKASR